MSNHAGVVPIDGLMLQLAVHDQHPKQRVPQLPAADDPMTTFEITDHVGETIQQTLYKLLTTRPRPFTRPAGWRPVQLPDVHNSTAHIRAQHRDRKSHGY
ncbi:hypothetical protein [Nocardia nova]|uniref:hypothetical protein n=1 Tax=Nocardia nova TaxID=37330 RepID=UPI0025B01424|nr:hypothetical protein [Nocardia nova]